MTVMIVVMCCSHSCAMEYQLLEFETHIIFEIQLHEPSSQPLFLHPVFGLPASGTGNSVKAKITQIPAPLTA